MPKLKLHIKKAERNEQYYRKQTQIQAPNGVAYNDWAITILFYSALHYADAALSQDASLAPNHRQPPNHSERNKAISKSLKLAPVAISYQNLYNRSIDARYNRIEFPDQLIQRLEQYDFKLIKQYIRSTLKLSP